MAMSIWEMGDPEPRGPDRQERMETHYTRPERAGRLLSTYSPVLLYCVEGMRRCPYIPAYYICKM